VSARLEVTKRKRNQISSLSQELYSRNQRFIDGSLMDLGESLRIGRCPPVRHRYTQQLVSSCPGCTEMSICRIKKSCLNSNRLQICVSARAQQKNVTTRKRIAQVVRLQACSKGHVTTVLPGQLFMTEDVIVRVTLTAGSLLWSPASYL
jgi:hypothetical protein